MRSAALPLWLLTLGATLAAQESMPPLRLQPFELVLQAHWETLTDTTYHFEKNFALVRELAPAAKQATYGASHFEPLLPPDAVEVGALWRFDAAAALPFLRQLHAGARIELHADRGAGISAHGAWACLRSLTADYAEIALRVHAEFLIDGDGADRASSWFTPAQFRGRLALDRRNGRVVAFQLLVPPSRANVDLNMHTDDGTICDIGSIPRLELTSGGFPELPPDAKRLDERRADQVLERAFYPFADVEWFDLAAARKESRATKKPLHVVLLFGSLTDEAC
ncbi:MAG TPA: hypothetical protein VFD82_05025 [Planctomycetota bacterium]|nr:hypothetical protein [Planctomycetota bacterium]